MNDSKSLDCAGHKSFAVLDGSKVKDFNELSGIISSLKEQGKTIIQCHGVFDLLHPGHIRHLEAAKKEGDVLLVTITRDANVVKGPGRPVFNERLRAESVAALECVDYVTLTETPTAVESIKALKPHVYVKGKDYADEKEDLTGKIHDEEDAIKSIGGRIHFTDEITFSSTKLLNLHFDVYPEEARSFLKIFRDKYSARDITARLQDLKKLKVLIIGDTIIDEYHYCTPLGKSPKEFLIPAKYLYEEAFAGGILAIANHIAGLCQDVHLITCLGKQQSHEEFISEHLKPNVKAKFFYRPDTSTTVKRRFVDHALLTKMFQVCFITNNSLPEPVEQEICSYLKPAIGDYDLVVVGDYGHGFLGTDIIRILCGRSRFLAVNVQANSANMGFNLITKYPRADYVCLDETEIRLATHDCTGQLENLLIGITQRLDCRRAVVTRGHLGSLVYSDDNGFFSTPVFSREAVDRVGAGDAYFAITSPCVAAQFPMDLVGFIGNAAGALKIRIVGNRSPVEPVPLFKYITTLLK
jgi:rfaE bifunctional protein nucleotidyltransferase chain/domain